MTGATAAPRRGRPRGTSPRELEVIALRLFSTQGFDETTVDQIADAAGVSSRTFFRYFESKAAVLWYAFDEEVAALRSAFGAIAPKTGLMDAIRQAVLSVNRYTAADVPELRTRMQLVSTVPALQASAAPHYDAWERVVIEYAALRLAQPTESLLPLAIGRATLAVCRAAYELWLTRADTDLVRYLDEAIAAMSRGFAPADS